MKILIISHEYPPIGGGGANACFFLSNEFARSGDCVTVISANYNDLPDEEEIIDNLYIYRVKCKRTRKEKSTFSEMFSYLISAYRKANKLLAKEKYDICLCFFGIPSGPLALFMKRKYNLPYAIRFGGGDIPGAQKRFKYLYKILSPFIRTVWKNADSLIANSEGLLNRAKKYEKRFPINIIENGVDTHFFTYQEKKNTDIITILFVSRLIEGKGLQYIIPDMQIISNEIRKRLNKKVILKIVGDGPYRFNLEKITAENEVSEFVSFEGYQEKNDVLKYYHEADIFILPSLSEGMPNVVLEAMACGLPVIMTPCEGSKELIDENGIISSLENFNENLITLASNEEMRKAMSQKALGKINTYFRWEMIAQRYHSVLEEILG